MQSLIFLLAFMPIALGGVQQEDKPGSVHASVSHEFADNDGVKIHFAKIGEGPLIVMMHGFPDYWYTWRDQMEVLKDDFQIAAMDLRGYNLSDQPPGVENYAMKHLMQDVIAVIKACGKEKAIIVGHDWGGAIAWQVAIHHPDVVEKLIVCNMTHPTGYSHVSIDTLRANGNQSYMDDFRNHTSETLSVSWLSGWVKDKEAKAYYERAFERSSIDAMINYYRANTKTREQRKAWLENPVIPELPKVSVPVLAIFGTQDKYVDKRGLNDTWEWLHDELTLVTIPEAGHFVQQDASERVSRSMKMWLLRDEVGLDSSGPIDEYAWLVGSWKREFRGKEYIERWEKASSLTLEGRGFEVGAKGEEVAVSEDLVLTVMGDNVFYLPKPKENELPVPFRLVGKQKEKLTFENASHDFPQRIEYERLKQGKLRATLSDMKREKVVEFEFEKLAD